MDALAVWLFICILFPNAIGGPCIAALIKGIQKAMKEDN